MAESVELVKTQNVCVKVACEKLLSPLKEEIDKNVEKACTTEKIHESRKGNEQTNKEHKRKKKRKPLPVPQSNSCETTEILKPVVHATSILNEQQRYTCELHHVSIGLAFGTSQTRFMCELCTYCCNSWGYLVEHIQNPNHMTALENWIEAESLRLLPAPLAKQVEYLDELLRRTVVLHGINRREERQKVVARIQESISQSFDGCTIQLYGSSLYLAGLTNSDVDLNIIVSDKQNLPNTMIAVFNCLKEDSANNRNVKLNILLKITSITFEDVCSRLLCAVTFNNSLSCEVCEMLKTYLSLDERALQLAIAFRYWAHVCQLDQVEYGTLPSYAFPILVIYFLQQLEDPVLPVFNWKDMCANKVDPQNKDWKTVNKMSLGELWIKLFKFYVTDFDMSEVIVCITCKTPVQRATRKKWHCRKFGIEDPVVPDRNIAKALVNMKSVQYFISCLRNSALYFATPQVREGAIFRRVQNPPPGMSKVHTLVMQRESFLNFIFLNHPFFQTDKQLQERNAWLIGPNDPSFSNIGKFIVTPEQANSMFQNFNPSYLHYEFHWNHLTCQQERPVICTYCREDGHNKDTCPWDSLPPIQKLPYMSEEYFIKMSNMCEAIFESWALTPLECENREGIVSHLLNFLRNNPRKPFPDIALKLFGSSCNGFGLRGSDVDICFIFTSCPPDEDLDYALLVQDLYVLLKSYSPFINLVPITTARVPILKFVHRETNLEGDISFHNILALRNTKLISAYSCIDRRAKVLGYVVKRFAKISGICDASKGSLSSYAYVLMMIHFLQQCNPPVLPVLQEICRPSESTEEYTLENYNVYYFSDLDRLPCVWQDYGKNTKSIGELWIEFLCYYTEVFDFSECVICIRKKQLLLKFDKLWNEKCIAIEDPFNLDHNLGIGLRPKMNQFILKAFVSGRMYFSTMENMLDTKPLSSAAERYFEGSKVKGCPPDRGCHRCKKIGHRVKDCPERLQKRDVLDPKELPDEKDLQELQMANQPNREVKANFKGNSNSSGAQEACTDKGKKKEWWKKINMPPEVKPVKQYVSNPNWDSRPNSLQNTNIPEERRVQVQALPHKLHVGPGSNKTVEKARKTGNRQSPQRRSGQVIDVFSKPEAEIPSMEFYNKAKHYSSTF